VGDRDKFGRETVRAISDPHSGKIITGRVAAPNDNFQSNLVGVGSTPAARIGLRVDIEGVVVKAPSTNSQGSTVYIMEQGGEPGDAFPLVAGDTVSIQAALLGDIYVLIPVTGDVINYIAIVKAD